MNSFNPAAVNQLMCTDTLSVAWDGHIYDCDFNQQLQLGIAANGTSASSKALTVWDIDSLDDLAGRMVRVGSHCYGCTAGSGSGCQGATV